MKTHFCWLYFYENCMVTLVKVNKYCIAWISTETYRTQSYSNSSALDVLVGEHWNFGLSIGIIPISLL